MSQNMFSQGQVEGVQTSGRAPSIASSNSASSSRSSSPSPDPLPEMAVESFFKSVTLGGFPKPAVKAQPWKKVWPAPQDPTKDGKMVVACPKKCVYGSSNLGGY